MFTVFDVQVDLPNKSDSVTALKLRAHLKVLSIEAIGLDEDEISFPIYALPFAAYATVSAVLLRRMIEECIRDIFPLATIVLVQRR